LEGVVIRWPFWWLKITQKTKNIADLVMYSIPDASSNILLALGEEWPHFNHFDPFS